MVGTSQQGDRWWRELKVDSATRHLVEPSVRSTLIKAQLFGHNVRGYRKKDIG